MRFGAGSHPTVRRGKAAERDAEVFAYPLVGLAGSACPKVPPTQQPHSALAPSWVEEESCQLGKESRSMNILRPRC